MADIRILKRSLVSDPRLRILNGQSPDPDDGRTPFASAFQPNEKTRGMLTYLIRYGAMGHIGDSVPSRNRRPVSSWSGRRHPVTSRHGARRNLDPSSIKHVRPNRTAGSNIPQATTPAGTRRTANLVCSVAAGSEDLTRAEQMIALQPARFARCQHIFQEEGWPWELLDVEPLLDGNTTVLHYLGPHQIDATSVRARFRVLRASLTS